MKKKKDVKLSSILTNCIYLNKVPTIYLLNYATIETVKLPNHSAKLKHVSILNKNEAISGHKTLEGLKCYKKVSEEKKGTWR